MAYLTNDDYSVLIRNEIKDLLLENYSETRLKTAENMAISQVKNRLASRYDTDSIFSAENESRDSYIVMIVLDCTLYHLYTATIPNKIPEIRAQRYQDALDWLRSVGKGEEIADLPTKTEIENTGGFVVKSKYPVNNNRW